MNLVPDAHIDRVNRRLGIGAVLLLVFLLGLAFAYGPSLLRGASASGAVKNGTDLTSCRSVRNTLVTDAADTVDRANTATGNAVAHVVVLLLDGRRAGAMAQASVIDADRIAAATAQDAKTRAVARYKAEVHLSTVNPARFLDLCKEHP